MSSDGGALKIEESLSKSLDQLIAEGGGGGFEVRGARSAPLSMEVDRVSHFTYWIPLHAPLHDD